MQLDERIVTQAIAETYFNKFKRSINLDVAIVGGRALRPHGRLEARGTRIQGCAVRTQAVHRRRHVGRGGMTWNAIVVQDEAKHMLDEAGVPVREFRPGYWTADAVTATTTLASRACLAGAMVFNCMSVEDVCLRGGERRGPASPGWSSTPRPWRWPDCTWTRWWWAATR